MGEDDASKCNAIRKGGNNDGEDSKKSDWLGPKVKKGEKGTTESDKIARDAPSRKTPSRMSSSQAPVQKEKPLTSKLGTIE
ncbi:hypothetical protein OSTOST_19800, partial [Ostertagia ostertagi]